MKFDNRGEFQVRILTTVSITIRYCFPAAVVKNCFQAKHAFFSLKSFDKKQYIRTKNVRTNRCLR